MSKAWPRVKLGEVLKRSDETFNPLAYEEYREITVRLWGKGVIERGTIGGASISGRRFIARAGQLIISRIDARNGALGIVPPSLDGSLVTNDFPLFNINQDRLNPSFFEWLCRTAGFAELCMHASEGTTNRVRLKENRFLNLDIPLPTLSEQKRIVFQINELAAEISEIRAIREEQGKFVHQMLLALFADIIKNSPQKLMRNVAPVVRRPVEVVTTTLYPELGIRSFGNGTFHKPALSGLELGGKRIFKIETGDLLFSNVFAWEGAIAVARNEDDGRFGSHRFITCITKEGEATARFLCFYFLTNKGMELISAASPGGAGRNRTLGLEALGNICVPIPPYESQLWFDSLQAEVDQFKRLETEIVNELDALILTILDSAFKRGN